MLRKLLLLPLFLAALASPAAATLLEVTVAGTIAGGNDLDGSVFGLGPNGSPAGLPVTIVFLIDTTQAPADSFASSSLGDYRVERGYGFALPTPDPNLDYISTTWTINGISRTSFLGTRDQIDHIFISDSATPGALDSYTIRDGGWDGNATTNARLFYVTLGALVAADLTTGDVLAQPFTSLNAVANSQSCGQCAGFWEDHTNGKSENASWFLSQTGISVSYRAVPEPSLLALLLGAGVLGRAFAPRRTNLNQTRT